MIIHDADKDDYARWDALPFYSKVPTTVCERVAAIRFQVRCWAEREIDLGNNPTFHHFVREYPEWNYEECHETIGEELYHVKHSSR